ncbi:MAG: hypothetical protein QOG77_1369 [Solirubrobacteraceae bacterium]|nr:hypothetical protein [Solirubrobacteraceae bacterium]
MTDETTTADALDPLVERLERAAEQLRSGDLSPDAAATEPLPGQDTLL